MKVRVTRARYLSSDDISQWRMLQDSNPALASPYFCPEFTLAVDAVRDNVEVAIAEENGTPVGFLPYQRGRFGCAQAVGAPLSDFHGVISAPRVSWSIKDLMTGSGLSTLDFDHWVESGPDIRPFAQHRYQSPYMDVSSGFGAYVKQRIDAGSEIISQTLRRQRKLAREVGPLRFEINVAHDEPLETVFRLKSQQYRVSGHAGVFATQPWTVRLIKNLHQCQTDRFQGVLSVLYAGSRLTAAHFGIRSKRVWHWWFPVYDHAFSRCSPGLILLLRIAEAAASVGIRRVDLGRGDEPYKQRFCSDTLSLLGGLAAVPTITSALRRRYEAGVSRLRESQAGPWVLSPGRFIHRLARACIYR
jgi:CelD/BcsL family acetyltransferase involved in cellulose biosynthesis